MLCRPAAALHVHQLIRGPKDTSLPFQALRASLALRLLWPALRFPSSKLLRKKGPETSLVLQNLVFYIPRKLFVMN